MTDPARNSDDDALSQDDSAAESADSSTQMADIHRAAAEEPKPQTASSSALFVPLASESGNATETADPADVPIPPSNPFDRHDEHYEPAQETLVDSVQSNREHRDDFHAFAPPPTASGAPSESPAPPPPLQSPPKSQINVLILTWASLATLTAIYLWWTRPNHPSNLDTIPDDGVLTSMLSTKRKVSPLEPLDERLIVGLKQTRRLGLLEVTPVGIEHRTVKVLASDGKVAYKPHVLALKLRVKNVDADRAFAPADPVFTSVVQRGTGPRSKQPVRVKGKIVFEDGYTYTFAHPVGEVESIEKRILPLSIEYAKDERVAEQEFPTLQPGESAEVILLSQEDALPKLKGAMMWRVKLRKGRNAQGTGAAVVVGVPFKKDDVVMKVPPPESRLDG
jgi:hypothetical protein